MVKSNYSERAIQWVKRKIYQYLFYNKVRRYIDILKKLEDSWNNDSGKNPSGLAPNKITLANQTKVFYKLYENIYTIIGWAKNIQYKVGDRVRIATNASGQVFGKSYKPQFSEEVYKIDRVLKGSPARYGIASAESGEALSGTWYAMELSPVETKA